MRTDELQLPVFVPDMIVFYMKNPNVSVSDIQRIYGTRPKDFDFMLRAYLTQMGLNDERDQQGK